MKGIILAGGAGTRLYPMSLVASKQLQPVYDKPMIYYPLTTLLNAGIREFCLISTPEDLPRFKKLLGDGKQWGATFDYREQAKPEGLAQAFTIAESFIGKDSVTLILGDNIFDCDFSKAFAEFKNGATIFGYPVKNPSRYGVVEINKQKQAVSIEEKPEKPKSNLAVPGIYICDNNAVAYAKQAKRSARGEFEITEVLNAYLRQENLRVVEMERGTAWLDAGTSSSLHDAASYIRTIEERTGIKLGCPEEAAYKQGFITKKQLEELVKSLKPCEYRDYLVSLLERICALS